LAELKLELQLQPVATLLDFLIAAAERRLWAMVSAFAAKRWAV
jgi:hypothetical protein